MFRYFLDGSCLTDLPCCLDASAASLSATAPTSTVSSVSGVWLHFLQMPKSGALSVRSVGQSALLHAEREALQVHSVTPVQLPSPSWPNFQSAFFSMRSVREIIVAGNVVNFVHLCALQIRPVEKSGPVPLVAKDRAFL